MNPSDRHVRWISALSLFAILVVSVFDLAWLHVPGTTLYPSNPLARIAGNNRSRDDNSTTSHDSQNGPAQPDPPRASPNVVGAANETAGRIRCVLVHGRPYRHTYSTFACHPQPKVVNPLPKSLQRPGLLDFFPDISTALKIAVVGDSVGVQIAQLLEEALGSQRKHRVVHEETHVSNLVVSHPVRGGGAFLSFRVNGMLWPELQMVRRQRRQRHLLQPRTNLGQHPHHRQLQLFPQPWNRSHVDGAMNGPPQPLETVDVLVQRITFPWTPLRRITIEALERNNRMASEVFGMRTLVFVNFYFCNNVADPDMHRRFREKLQLVRNFTRTFVPQPNSTLQRVLLLDMDRLVDLLNEENARSIGYDVINEPFEQWMMSHYRGPLISTDTNATTTAEAPKATQHHYHAQVCGERVPDNALSCVRNSIFFDGMHFCPSTVGGRVVSGIACLIECAERDESRIQRLEPPESAPDSFLRRCERRCNDKFMSLEPIPASEMVPYNDTSHSDKV
jgi:hypothetical protein